MHAIEKILAKNSGRAEVHTGEIVTAKVDFAEINDLYLQTVYSFYEMGGEKVWNRERAAFVFDHYAPAPTSRAQQTTRRCASLPKRTTCASTLTPTAASAIRSCRKPASSTRA